MICLIAASLLGTPVQLNCPPPRPIEIVLTESEIQKREREEREARRKVVASPAYKTYSGAKIIGSSSEQCVEAYKRLSGRGRPLGYAGDIPSQGDYPLVGAGALWRDYGHIGYITAVNGDMVTVVDANWIKGKLTEHTLPTDKFRGFIYN